GSDPSRSTITSSQKNVAGKPKKPKLFITQVEMEAIGAASLQQRYDENALKLSKIKGELGSLGSAVKVNFNLLFLK
ncbi:hypothetical protein MKX03_008543, partial [Papaver bracteatum]